MGMEAEYYRITPDTFAELQANRYYDASSYLVELAQETSFAEPDPDSRHFSLYKEWHALHFLLTGDASLDEPCQVPPPLGNVVLGGAPTTIPGGWDEDGFEGVAELYPHFIQFFDRAAESGDIVLLTLRTAIVKREIGSQNLTPALPPRKLNP
jgi:hypothetical protein